MKERNERTRGKGEEERGEEGALEEATEERRRAFSSAPCLLPLSPSPHLEPARSFASSFARSLAASPPIGRPASARARSLASFGDCCTSRTPLNSQKRRGQREEMRG